MKRILISLLIITASLVSLCLFSNAKDHPFIDIKRNSWYEESTRYCYDHGYMKGTAAAKFSPSSNMTRAMAVQILYSVTDRENEYTKTSFTDVQPNKWFYNAVEWAYQNGIVSGTGNGRFSPNANITRQDFYVMLYNYTLLFSHAEKPQILESYLWYSDLEDIADYASDSLNWAGYYELVSGYDDMTLKPRALITRAEVTSIIQRYDHLLGHAWICNDRRNASCTSDGYAQYTCSICSAVKNVMFDKGHIWYLNSVSQGNCMVKGTNEFKCINCTVIRSESTKYGDHSFVRTSTVNPTRTKQGYSVYTCIYCNGTNHRDYTAPLGRTEGWDSNYDGKLTIDEYFGAYNIVEFLTAHKSDYVGTPYKRLADYINQPWMLIHDKGSYPDSPGMNCTGFVASVISRCGGNFEKLNKTSAGSYVNAYNWYLTAVNKNIHHYTFYSVSQALKSGRMKKGDIVLFLPAAKSETNPEPDFHFGIYWGDYAGHDLFWHSTGATTLNWNAGVRGLKNQITKMASGTEYSCIYVFPMQQN